ncbi:MAG: hypothetical protein E7052_00710 [Lentisphaerae bacterium]|nr:hypothetical protein [Lentisphaerota bacterium]
MKIFYLNILGSLAVVFACVQLSGADLVLNDGRIYKNYRIKSVNNNIATVVYTLPDGTPDVVYLNAADLANAPAARVQPPAGSPGAAKKNTAAKKRKSWRSAKTLRGKLMAAGEQLYDDVNALPANDWAGRSAMANRMRSQIQRVIAGMSEVADFKLIAANQNGALLRVVGTEPGAKFKSGQHIFVQNLSPRSRTFKLRVYPGGEIINYGNYGNVMVYADNDAAACDIAVGYIGNYLGDNTIFNPLPPAAAAGNPVFPTHDQGLANGEQPPQNTVINNYYIEDDNRVPVVVWRNGGNRKPGKPGKPQRPPEKRPEPPQKPGRPDMAPGKQPHKPEPPEPEKKRPTYKWSKSSVNKNSGHSGNYGVLPEWAVPGKTRR